jgi:hypothetical protein
MQKTLGIREPESVRLASLFLYYYLQDRLAKNKAIIAIETEIMVLYGAMGQCVL